MIRDRRVHKELIKYKDLFYEAVKLLNVAYKESADIEDMASDSLNAKEACDIVNRTAKDVKLTMMKYIKSESDKDKTEVIKSLTSFIHSMVLEQTMVINALQYNGFMTISGIMGCYKESVLKLSEDWERKKLTLGVK